MYTHIKTCKNIFFWAKWEIDKYPRDINIVYLISFDISLRVRYNTMFSQYFIYTRFIYTRWIYTCIFKKKFSILFLNDIRPLLQTNVVGEHLQTEKAIPPV